MALDATKKKRKTSAKGFTLLEILAALLLIGLVLPAVMKGLSLASILVADSDRKYEALDLAETKLGEVLLEESWKTNTAGSGNFDEDEFKEYEFKEYEWTLDVSNWTEANLKQVEVAVTWQQRNRPREVRLTTLVYDSE